MKKLIVFLLVIVLTGCVQIVAPTKAPTATPEPTKEPEIIETPDPNELAS